MGAVSPWHLAILAVVVIALFGAKRLPDTARGVGQSLKILKAELRGGGESTPQVAEAQPAAMPSTDQSSAAAPPNRPAQH